MNEPISFLYRFDNKQQLLARKLLAHCNFAAQVQSDQMKDCLAKINANRV
jgi:hypothetical protein